MSRDSFRGHGRTPDAAATLTAAYATEGAAIDLGRARARGRAARDAAVKVPLATMNRHGLVAGATGTGKTKTLQLLAEQLSRAGRARARRRRQGRRLRARRAPPSRAAPGRSGWPTSGCRSPPDGVPGRVPRARRPRPGRAGPRDGERLRPAAARQGARGERDAGVEPRARLPLRRRQGPAAARPRPTCARCSRSWTPTRASPSWRGSAGCRRPRSACSCARSSGWRPAAGRSSSASRSSTSPTCCASRRTAAGSSPASSSPPCRTSRRCGRRR